MNKINLKSYLGSLAVIFALMLLCFILTFLIPAGEYARTADGMLDTAGGYSRVEGGISFGKWLLSPFLVLGADGGMTLIAVIAFLLVIGGVMEVLNRCNFIRYMLDGTVAKFGKSKYLLIAVLILLFMLMGAFVGSFEEVVPLVPIAVALSLALGFDIFLGISVSLIAVGCGFASGVMNPFTVGVAQNLAGLPMFSGVWLRALSFVLIYALLTSFTLIHAKKTQKATSNEEETAVATPENHFVRDKKMNRALLGFVLSLGSGILLILSSAFLTFLQDFTLYIIAAAFLVGGTLAGFLAGSTPRRFFADFGNGVLSVLPAILMILMASSIKYTLTEAKVLDTVLHAAVGVAEKINPAFVILFIYFIVLFMNFFIASGSAKAFLLIPLILPLAQIFGISPQLCIVAFAFGDGFSNVFYPTNPALLISLGLCDLPYTKYVRSAWKFQLANLVLTCGILLFGYFVGY